MKSTHCFRILLLQNLVSRPFLTAAIDYRKDHVQGILLTRHIQVGLVEKLVK